MVQAFSQVLLPIVVVVAMGYLLQGAFLLDTRTLNRVSLYLLSPCLLFITLLRTEIAAGQVLALSLLMLLVVVAMSGCAYLLARVMRLEPA